MGFGMVWIPLLMCLEANDRALKSQEIPDSLSVRVLLTGFMATGLSWHSITFIDALWGALAAFLATLPVLWLNEMKNGEAKFLAALAAWIGVQGIGMMLGGILAAGILSRCFHFVRNQSRPAYAPAITVGFAVATLFPD